MTNAAAQTEMVVQCMKTRIADKIVEILKTVRDVRTVTFDKVKLLASDFTETEIPAIQLIDVSQTGNHEQSRVKYMWLIALELTMKQTADKACDQRALWNLEYQVKRKLWTTPNLGVPGVVHMQFVNAETDLHLLEPFYFARIFFEVHFYESLVRDC